MWFKSIECRRLVLISRVLYVKRKQIIVNDLFYIQIDGKRLMLRPLKTYHAQSDLSLSRGSGNEFPNCQINRVRHFYLEGVDSSFSPVVFNQACIAEPYSVAHCG